MRPAVSSSTSPTWQFKGSLSQAKQRKNDRLTALFGIRSGCRLRGRGGLWSRGGLGRGGLFGHLLVALLFALGDAVAARLGRRLVGHLRSIGRRFGLGRRSARLADDGDHRTDGGNSKLRAQVGCAGTFTLAVQSGQFRREAHRIAVAPELELEGVTPDAALRTILERIEAPR